MELCVCARAHVRVCAPPAGREFQRSNLGFKNFVKNEDFKFQVKYNVKIS